MRGRVIGDEELGSKLGSLLAIIRTLTFILSKMRKYWYILFGVETSFDHSAVRSYNTEVKGSMGTS